MRTFTPTLLSVRTRLSEEVKVAEYIRLSVIATGPIKRFWSNRFTVVFFQLHSRTQYWIDHHQDELSLLHGIASSGFYRILSLGILSDQSVWPLHRSVRQESCTFPHDERSVRIRCSFGENVSASKLMVASPYSPPTIFRLQSSFPNATRPCCRIANRTKTKRPCIFKNNK